MSQNTFQAQQNFQEVASTTSEIIVRNELEKYIADLENAVGDLDSEINQIENENEDLHLKNQLYSEKIRDMMLKLATKQYSKKKQSK